MMELQKLRSAAVLFSGGIDSTVLLGLAIEAAIPRLVAIEVDYPWRPIGERRAALAVAAALRISPIRIEYMPPQGCETRLRRLSAMLLLSICDQTMEQIDIGDVLVGTIKEDWDKHSVPQAGLYYYRSLERLLMMHGSGFRKLHLPLYHLPKSEVVRMGKAVGAPIALSWSCISAGDHPCGCCTPCKEAISAVTSLGGQ